MKIVFLGANNPQTVKEINAQKRVHPDFEVAGFLDNDPNKIGKPFHGYPVLGNLKSCRGLDLDSVRFLDSSLRAKSAKREESSQILFTPALTSILSPSGVGFIFKRTSSFRAWSG